MSEEKLPKTQFEEKVLGDLSQFDINTLRHTYGKELDAAQFNLFLKTAASSGLNPFLNHIYAAKMSGQMVIMVSVDGIIHLARQKEGFAGYDSQLVCENDEFELSRENNGQWQITKHKIGFPVRGQIVGAYAIAKRKNFDDVIVYMEKQEIGDKQSGTWKNYFSDMFKKHVLKRALRQQFGIEIDDMTEDQAPPIDTQTRREIVHDEEGEEVPAGDAREEKIKELTELVAEKGLVWPDVDEFAQGKFGGATLNELNAQQLTGLIKLLPLLVNKKTQKEEAPPEPEKEADPEPDEFVQEEWTM